MRRQTLTIGIEAAVDGGSIAVFEDALEVASFRSDATVSRAEDLLSSIEILISSQRIMKGDISQIAVSAGPGSFTGIRIGIATGMGLALGLGIPLRQLSILESMALTSGYLGGVTAAVPMGRGMVCTQTFSVDETSSTALTEMSLIGHLDFEGSEHVYPVVMPSSFLNGLAGCLCRASRDPRAAPNAAPIFVSKA